MALNAPEQENQTNMLHPNEKRWIYLRQANRAVLVPNADEEAKYGEFGTDYQYQPWSAEDAIMPETPATPAAGCDSCAALNGKLQDVLQKFDQKWAALAAERDALRDRVNELTAGRTPAKAAKAK